MLPAKWIQPSCRNALVKAMEPDDVGRDDAERAGEPIHFAPVQLELVEEDRRSQGDEGDRYDGFGA